MTNDVTALPDLDRMVRTPGHVVFRHFPAETVALNLDSGKYHGLNTTAGRMLDVINESASIREAAAEIAAEFDHPVEAVESDMLTLCHALSERGLIEFR